MNTQRLLAWWRLTRRVQMAVAARQWQRECEFQQRLGDLRAEIAACPCPYRRTVLAARLTRAVHGRVFISDDQAYTLYELGLSPPRQPPDDPLDNSALPAVIRRIR
ncbi:hypothetical protein ACFP81_06485 [Deinococcus lacus]|uniref:Uncharacterized protein n=1 Tax=Deinococcus lacus TaxID=392561 RepID=A0ABW1YCI5_9DEIO